MRKLRLIPDGPLQARYRRAGRGERLDSPSISYGAIEAAQARVARAVWSDLSPLEFSYMLAFWRTATGEGSNAFLIDLPFPGAALIEYVAAFDGGLRISRVTGGSATIDGTISFAPRALIYPLSTARAALISTITEDVA